MQNILDIQLNADVMKEVVISEVQRLLPHLVKQSALEPITIDLKTMVEITGLSDSALRKHVLYDPRIQMTELNFVSGKRLWDYKGFKKVYLELAKNNDFTKL